jgi:hypothetical protein
MWKRCLLLFSAVIGASACGRTASPVASDAGGNCGTGGGSGVAYDVSRSRFAFGGAPVRSDVGSEGVRWTGPDGSMGIFTNGYGLGIILDFAPSEGLRASAS